jgi:hypothetical protein
MSLLLRVTRSRLLPKTNSTFFHTSRISREEWTKASLRRMKKPELIRVAKEHQLSNISGTKNDIIIQLLNLQTAKIVGSHAFVRQAVEKTDESPIDAVLTTEPAQKAAIETTASEEEVDADWVNAFDMKVAQRGSRKPLSNSSPGPSVSKPHRFNDMIKKTIAKPVVEEVAPPAVQDQKVTQVPNNVEEVDGMDPQWVEAFDLKVGSRGARSHSKFADTLTPSPKPTIASQIEFISNTEKKEDHHKETVKETPELDIITAEQPSTEKNNEQSNQTTKENINQLTEENNRQSNQSITNNDNHTNSSSSSSRDTWINTAVGSYMFLWYFGGEDGSLSKIWYFLSSSS